MESGWRSSQFSFTYNSATGANSTGPLSGRKGVVWDMPWYFSHSARYCPYLSDLRNAGDPLEDFFGAGATKASPWKLISQLSLASLAWHCLVGQAR